MRITLLVAVRGTLVEPVCLSVMSTDLATSAGARVVPIDSVGPSDTLHDQRKPLDPRRQLRPTVGSRAYSLQVPPRGPGNGQKGSYESCLASQGKAARHRTKIESIADTLTGMAPA